MESVCIAARLSLSREESLKARSQWRLHFQRLNSFFELVVVILFVHLL